MKFSNVILWQHVGIVNFDNLVVKYFLMIERFLHTMICGLNDMYWC